MTVAERPAVTGRLSPAQVEEFHRQGFLSPLTACTPEEMAQFRRHCEELIAHRTDRKEDSTHNMYLLDRGVWELATLPPIVAAMQSVMGEDLMLWRTHFFIKNPGDPEIPWHQDRNYWPLEPEVVISAWLAIDAATIENSALQIIPGSHRSVVGHVPALPGQAFKKMADPAQYDASKKVDLELQPGQFILFNERTMHHSEPNRSGKRRIGMAIRVIIPQVRVLKYDSHIHKMIQISGEDRMGFNQHTDPPTGNLI